mgnify:CR=1 FL=1
MTKPRKVDTMYRLIEESTGCFPGFALGEKGQKGTMNY